MNEGLYQPWWEVCVFWLCSASVSPGKNYWVQPAGVLSQLMFRCWDSQPPHMHNFVHAGVHTINVFTSLRERPQLARSHNSISTVQPSARRSMADALLKFTVWIWRGTGSRHRLHQSPLKDCLFTAHQNRMWILIVVAVLQIWRFFHEEKPNKTAGWRFLIFEVPDRNPMTWG